MIDHQIWATTVILDLRCPQIDQWIGASGCSLVFYRAGPCQMLQMMKPKAPTLERKRWGHQLGRLVDVASGWWPNGWLIDVGSSGSSDGRNWVNHLCLELESCHIMSPWLKSDHFWCLRSRVVVIVLTSSLSMCFHLIAGQKFRCS